MGIATAIIELITASVELGFKVLGSVIDLAGTGSSFLEHILH